MATVTYPGVYVEEISSGARPLDIVGTSTAAFVGLAERGPQGATRVTSWSQFQRLYGDFIDDGRLAHSVLQYFSNGGSQCYIVRVIREGAVKAAVTVKNRAAAGDDGVTFSAKNEGDWGNRIYLSIDNGTHDPGNEFKVSVRRQDDSAVIPDRFADKPALEVFDDLSVDPAAPRFYQTILSSGSVYVDAAPTSGNTAVGHGVHRGGGAPALPLLENRAVRVNVDGDGFQTVTLPDAVKSETDPAKVADALQAAVRGLTKNKASTPDTAFTAFTAAIERDGNGAEARLVLQSGTERAQSSVRLEPAPQKDASTKLRLGSGNGGVSEDGAAVRRPAALPVVEIGDAVVGRAVLRATKGGDGSGNIGPATFANAFSQLDTITDASLLAVPGEGSPAMVDLGMAYCGNRPLRDMFYIGEMADHDVTAEDAAAFRTKLTALNSYGAVYFPWVKALDPSGRSSEPMLLPPSGYIAGLYGRIDAARGVWKAPAGTGASLNGVVGLAAELTDVEHGNLNPLGVNVLRRLPAGVVSFGARTLSSDPEWRYIPVRRTAIMLRVSIYYGIQWAVFEPNDESLWSQLRLNIGSFMTTLFRQGAFQGSTTAQAFFVKCDGETTTQADIDRGVVNVQVGFAPLKPAEFVVVTISQKAGQAST
ncbi:MAG: phage tail sheath family protein [Candidatus Sericytochromatia bacterium]